jgi:hypothetical protein
VLEDRLSISPLFSLGNLLVGENTSNPGKHAEIRFYALGQLEQRFPFFFL